MNTKTTNNMSNLLKQIDIVSLVKNYINLSKKGQNFWGVCPFHNDSSPSLSVSEKKQFFKCFACNHSGNAIKFVMDFKKINFYEAIKEIEQVLNIELGINNLNINEHDIKLFNLMNLAKDTYEGFLLRDENNDKLQYLLDRKITRNQITKFSIGYAPNEQKKLFEIAINKDDIRGVFLEKSELFNLEDLELSKLINIDQQGNIYDFFRNRIMIPIFDQANNVVGFSGRTIGDEQPKYMNSPTSQIFKKDEILYNINNLDTTKHKCYLVEGFMDLYALDEVGVDNPLATMGTAFSDNHIKLLITNKITDIILCFDNDHAGVEATIKTGEKIGKRLNVFTLKPNQTKHKDFNDILINDGIDELTKIVNSTVHFSVFYLEHFLSNANKVGDLEKENNFKEAISIIKKTGNNLYLNDYKKTINSYLGIDTNIIDKELSNLHFNSYKQYNKKDFHNNNKTDKKISSFNYKQAYYSKNLNIQKIFERIVKLNHYLFLSATLNKEYNDYINRNYTLIEIPYGISLMFEKIEEYYNEFPAIKSIYEDRLNFLDWCSNNKQIYTNVEMLFQTFDPRFVPDLSSIQKNINYLKLNEILYNLALINDKLDDLDNLTQEQIDILDHKKKALQSKKIELEKILSKK